MTTYVEVRSPATRESDADAALRMLRLAARSRVRANARDAVKLLGVAAGWVWKSAAWERLNLAASRIGLRLGQGRPWLRVLREELAAVAGTLEQLSGRERDGQQA